MRLICSIFLGLTFFLSCGSDKEVIHPSNCTLKKEKLKDVLNDIFIYESGLKTHSLKKEYKEVLVSDVYQSIYDKHQTTKQEIANSVECYTQKKEMIPLLKKMEKLLEKESKDFWQTDNDSTNTIK